MKSPAAGGWTSAISTNDAATRGAARMRLYRIAALIERDMRKFFRNPALMMASTVFPLVQLVVLGYAFGGQITNVLVALVDKDHGTQALRRARAAERHRAVSQDLSPRGVQQSPRGHDTICGPASSRRSSIFRPIIPSASCAARIRASPLSKTTPIPSPPAALPSACSSFRPI